MKYVFLNEDSVVIHVKENVRDENIEKVTEKGFIPAPDFVVCGFVYQGGEFKEPAVTISWDDVRDARNKYLRETDWTQLLDAPLSDDERNVFADKRKKMRDLPQKSKTPDAAMKELLKTKDKK